MTAAFLWAQLENMENIQAKRKAIWNTYHSKLQSWATFNNIRQPQIPAYADNNAHMYYLCFENLSQRQYVIEQLKDLGIHSVSHYLSLHDSKYCRKENHQIDRVLPMSDRYTDCLLRLPLFYELDKESQLLIIEALKKVKLWPVSPSRNDKQYHKMAIDPKA